MPAAAVLRLFETPAPDATIFPSCFEPCQPIADASVADCISGADHSVADVLDGACGACGKCAA
jgi:hypothetical protein